MLNYSIENPPPKSRITNKRIAFPLNSTSKQTGSDPQQSVLVPTEELQRAIENFKMLLSKVDMSERLELQQKLKLLKNCALPESAQKYIIDISIFLCQKNVTKVNEIQLKLSMEHGAVCAPWIGLITRLASVIQSKR